MKRRVVITGLSTINPLGDTLETYYQNLIAGKSGIVKWSSIDLSNVECKIGGDLGRYDWKGRLETLKQVLPEEVYKKTRKLLRNTTFSARLTILCALSAYHDAGLFDAPIDRHLTSVLVPGHNLNSNYIFENTKQFLEEPEFIEALSGVEGIDPNVPALITEILGLHGPAFTIGGACASGNLALRDGFRDIVSGECDRAVIAGAPFDVSPADIHASVIIQAVVIKKEYQDKPEEASRPFDAYRCGFVYSHGAATLILEELESAKRHGSPIYGELLGVRANANANHLPAPEAVQQAWVMKRVLEDCNVAPEQIDYVNCHATGTPAGDVQEIIAVKNALGPHAYKVKLNAPKSMLGHTCWASPLVETIGGLLQMKHGTLHPSINISKLDPGVDLDVCLDGPVDHRINYMLKNSFGFGGLNCCSVIKRFEE